MLGLRILGLQETVVSQSLIAEASKANDEDGGQCNSTTVLPRLGQYHCRMLCFSLTSCFFFFFQGWFYKVLLCVIGITTCIKKQQSSECVDTLENVQRRAREMKTKLYDER